MSFPAGRSALRPALGIRHSGRRHGNCNDFLLGWPEKIRPYPSGRPGISKTDVQQRRLGRAAPFGRRLRVCGCLLVVVGSEQWRIVDVTGAKDGLIRALAAVGEYWLFAISFRSGLRR